MKNKILYFLIVILFASFWSPVSAGDLCFSDGYTVITINGMIADREAAEFNKGVIEERIPPFLNNQKITVDYIHNETHLAGAGDLLDAIRQKLSKKSFVVDSYDLNNMLTDLSQKLKTQKVLFVAHSQGNFYANDIYNKTASKEGGIPKESLGIYGIASPASYVAGGGKYITSSNDGIINLIRKTGWFLDILEPNVEIKSPINQDNLQGHSLSKVYLKYEGDRIASEIKSSIDKLQNNNKQNSNEPCISAPKLTAVHKVKEVFYTVADPTAIVLRSGVVGVYKGGKFLADLTGNLGSSLGKNLNRLLASVGGSSLDSSVPETEVIPEIVEPEELPLLDLPSEEILPIFREIETPEELPLPAPLPEEKPPVPTPEPEPIIEEIPPTFESSTPIIYSGGSGGGGGGGGGDLIIPEVTESESESESETESESESEPETEPELELEKEEDPILDIIAPIISLIGNDPIEIEKDLVYIDEGATATDDIDGVITVVTTGVVDTSIIGIYTITYTATDLAENVSTLTRTINVVEPVVVAPIVVAPIYDDLIIDSNITLTPGEYFYNNLTITNNAVLTLEGDPLSTNSFKGVKINATNIIVDAGSKISADGQGYVSGLGSNTASDHGSSYGGRGGGDLAKDIYGSATEPLDLGSGAEGKRGGGAIYLVVSGRFQNNGIISANGNTYRSSGGSIYVRTNEITGAGSFTANGANTSWPNSKAGGGGRVAIYYKDFSFSGTAIARSGLYCLYGCNESGESGTVGFFDLSDNSLHINSTWRFEKNNEPFDFSKIIIGNKAKVTIEDGVEIKTDTLIIEGESSFFSSGNQVYNIPEIIIDGKSNLTLSGGETFNSNSILLKGASTMTLSGSENIIANLISVTGNSMITVVKEKILSLTIPNLTIESGSSISVDKKGYKVGSGTVIVNRAGGSYGGNGQQNSDNATYGSAVKPIDLGSGGVSGHIGGGAIRLVVTDTILNDGIISAGGDRNSSGGSIYLTAKNLEGSGTFRANGGGHYLGSVIYGAGGGGRVALHYESSSFSGTAEAKGGCGSTNGYSPDCGENGTVGFFDTTNNDLLVNTYWQFLNTDSPFNFNNIYISNGAKVKTESGVNITANQFSLDGASFFTLSGGETTSINNLNLLGNSIITVDPEKILSLNTSNINIESGSSILADGKGLVKGPGSTDVDYIAGASYGGKGSGVTAKPVYGSEDMPVDFGSGAESYRGGGAIRLIVSGTLKNNGIISSNGYMYRSSGGSIYVTTNSLIGSGVFQADGARAKWPYGSVAGGGGRIAIYYHNNSFSGILTTAGGKYCNSGCRPSGEDGTIEMIDESIIPDPILGCMDSSFDNYDVTATEDTNPTSCANDPEPIPDPILGCMDPSFDNYNENATEDTDPTSCANDPADPTPDPDPIPDITSPVITAYTINGITGDITTNPLVTPMVINLTSSENVNWMSIIIQNQEDSTYWKKFQSGAGCVDGTDTCTKTWDGVLSSGGLLDDGTTYKLKVHTKDEAGNEFYDYLPAIITIDVI